MFPVLNQQPRLVFVLVVRIIRLTNCEKSLFSIPLTLPQIMNRRYGLDGLNLRTSLEQDRTGAYTISSFKSDIVRCRVKLGKILITFSVFFRSINKKIE